MENGNYYYIIDEKTKDTIVVDDKIKWNAIEEVETALKKYKKASQTNNHFKNSPIK